jgi:hypothetical protein
VRPHLDDKTRTVSARSHHSVGSGSATGGRFRLEDRAARGGTFSNKTETVASSRADIAAGQKIESLKFPETKIQRYGDVAIICTTYELVNAGRDGKKVTASGRATEIFRWDGTRWLHPGWHLDSGK